jgi:hypothetical protein
LFRPLVCVRFVAVLRAINVNSLFRYVCTVVCEYTGLAVPCIVGPHDLYFLHCKRFVLHFNKSISW